MKKSLQTKALKRGMGVALILLLTILLIHSCKQDRLQPEQIKHITVDRNKAAGLKGNLQKSTQNVPQSSLSVGTCYFAVPSANGNVSGPTGPAFDMVLDYIIQQITVLVNKQYPTRQDALNDFNSVNNMCYMYALDYGCNWSVGVLFDPVQEMCPGDEGYAVGGGQAPVVNQVTNNLTDPCKKAALSKITDTKIKNFVTGFYNNFLLPTDSKINVIFKEGNNLTVNNSIVPAYSTDPTPHNWEINISSNYYSSTSGYNMSQEGWGIIIAHEIIHVFIKENNLNNGNSSLDHVAMFKNFVNPTAQLLKDSFGMDAQDALKLALTGMKDLWGYSDFAALCKSTYDVTLDEINTNYDKYTKGTGGTKCN
ncbi:hypothetical protein [Pedobacter borealis]|uniref:hypothetical protein n=1 Tax=Pedobacter borealis TaxID=475254 RepID=UPI000493AA81|nr:hypothetical protein [Pedobacter borealis]